MSDESYLSFVARLKKIASVAVPIMVALGVRHSIRVAILSMIAAALTVFYC